MIISSSLYSTLMRRVPEPDSPRWAHMSLYLRSKDNEIPGLWMEDYKFLQAYKLKPTVSHDQYTCVHVSVTFGASLLNIVCIVIIIIKLAYKLKPTVSHDQYIFNIHCLRYIIIIKYYCRCCHNYCTTLLFAICVCEILFIINVFCLSLNTLLSVNVY